MSTNIKRPIGARYNERVMRMRDSDGSIHVTYHRTLSLAKALRRAIRNVRRTLAQAKTT